MECKCKILLKDDKITKISTCDICHKKELKRLKLFNKILKTSESIINNFKTNIVIKEKTLLQQWWEETYPNRGVDNILEVSEDNISLKELISFSRWVEGKMSK